MRSLFEGVGVAIITPFKEGKIDYSAFKNLIKKNIYEGAKAIIVLGTTGESSTITEEERGMLIAYAKRVIAGRVKLIVGTGSNDFKKAYKNTLLAKELGVDGELVVTPYYNKTTQAGLIEYYTRLCEIGLPIIMYNVPSRTGVTIEIDTIEKLIQNKMIYGLKESTADIQRIIHISTIYKDKVALYSGEDSLNYIFYTLGGNGAISVSANAYCQKVVKVYDLVKLGLYNDALTVSNSLAGINKALFCEVNPIPIKYLLHKLGLCENEVRMPLVPLSTNGEKLIEREMKGLL